MGARSSPAARKRQGAGVGGVTTLFKTAALIATVCFLQGCGSGDGQYELGDDPCTGVDPSAGGVNPTASDEDLRAQGEALRRSTYWMENPDLSAARACAAARRAVGPTPAETPAVGAGQAQRQPSAPTLPPQQAANGAELATILNLNGHLCARVVSANRLTVGGGQVFEVTCVEYRSGSGTVRYQIDMRQDPPRIFGG